MAAKNKRWQAIAKTGKFDETKALLSIKTTATDIASINVANAIDAIQYPSPTLATIKLYQGEQKAIAVIALLLAKVSGRLNVGKNMNKNQVIDGAQIIYDDYYYLNLAEIKLAFRRGIRGDYGKNYDVFDSSVAMGWLRQYVQDRPTAHNQDPGAKAPLPGEDTGDVIPWHPEAMKSLAELSRRIQIRQLKEREEKSTFKFYRTIEEYCNAKGIDYNQYCRDLHAEWKRKYEEEKPPGVSLNIYISFMISHHLLQLNDGK